MRIKILTGLVALLGVVALVLTGGAQAFALSMTLEGNGAGLRMDVTQALWASDSSGTPILITHIGAPAPGGGTFGEVGVPSMMPDGRVLFGAELDRNHTVSWRVYYGIPDLPSGQRVREAIPPAVFAHAPAGCSPQLAADPYPVADVSGDIAFISESRSHQDALFLYDGATLSCLAHAGDITNQGHRIALLAFGSPQMGESGQVVFEAWLEAKPDAATHQIHRQALLLASRKNGITELAVEGELGPDRSRYERPFGLPAALPSAEGTLVAFTAHTDTGAALFVYRDGTMARVLPTGTLTAGGPVTYLSPGRPGLMADGTTAVLVGVARVPEVFRLMRGRLDLRLSRGQLTPFGTTLESLGDPVLTASGAMFIGATDSAYQERLYVLEPNDAFFEVGSASAIYRISTLRPHVHSIFTGTLTVNQHGDFAYLGGR